MNNTYFDKSRRLDAADRRIYGLICTAFYYNREADEYTELFEAANDSCDLDGTADTYESMASYNKLLAICQLDAAKKIIWYLEDVGEIGCDDWRNINEWLNYFGCPPELRDSPSIIEELNDWMRTSEPGGVL